MSYARIVRQGMDTRNAVKLQNNVYEFYFFCIF